MPYQVLTEDDVLARAATDGSRAERLAEGLSALEESGLVLVTADKAGKVKHYVFAVAGDAGASPFHSAQSKIGNIR